MDRQQTTENKPLEQKRDLQNPNTKEQTKDLHPDNSNSSDKKKPGFLDRTKRYNQILQVLAKYKAYRGMTPVKLRMILEDLGPTYVKLGQIMSSRTDLIDPAYCRELEKLRSSANVLDEATVRKILEDTYGKKVEELFSSFTWKPIGAASMAQVHAAKTMDGEDVVVKIQRPGIYEEMELDVEMMKKAARLIDLDQTISGLIDLDAAIDEFWTTARQEMDFTQEAKHAIRFKENYKDCRYISAPKIYDEFTRKHVLVMEDIQGIEIDNYPALNEQGYSRPEIASKLASNYIDQVIVKGYFHADPHAGNIRIQDGKIVWLDFGMMGELSERDTQVMFGAVQALASKNQGKLTDYILAIGIPTREIDYSGFSNDLEAFMDRYMTSSLERIDVASMIEEIIRICHSYGIKLPSSITMLCRSLVTIEGTMKDLDPNVNVISLVAREKSSINDLDWDKFIKDLALRLEQVANQSLNIPIEMEGVLKLIRRGQLKMNLRVMDLPSIMPNLDKMVDRMVVCILIAALTMGSSIICTTDLKPRFLDIPLLGFLGFFLSFCLSVWLFFKMLFRRRDLF